MKIDNLIMKKSIQKIEDLPIGIDVREPIEVKYLDEDTVEIQYKEDTVKAKVLLTCEYTIVCYGNNLLLELCRDMEFEYSAENEYEMIQKGFAYSLYRIIAHAILPQIDARLELIR